MLSQYEDQPVPTTKTVDTPAAATAAIVTLAAVAGQRTIIDGIFWSYGAAPTGGRLTITDNAVSVLDIDITAAGPGPLLPKFVSGINTAVVVTLASGAGAVVGKLTVWSRKVGSAPGVAV